MKLIIFAGGIGTRLWPLSRKNSPKQFDKMFNGKSTIELAFNRVEPHFGRENIFVQTVPLYRDIIKEQLPLLPAENIILEPERRDLGAAVCLGLTELKKRGHSGAMAILWSDHLMDRTEEFIRALKTAEELIADDSERFVFLGERPRFANNNLGWIKTGKNFSLINNLDVSEFSGWKYRPALEDCAKMHKSGTWLWNPGYFVTSIEFLSKLYENLAPEIYKNVIAGEYEKAPAVHFDEAILEKMDYKKAVVLKTNMGWSDPGTLYALKEAMEDREGGNVSVGKVFSEGCFDSLLYNTEKNKLVVAVGLKGMIVVNTADAILIIPKNEVSHLTKMIKKMSENGLEEYL